MRTITPFKDGKYIPVEEALKQLQAYKVLEHMPVQETPVTAPTITDTNNYLMLENIICVGADGNKFEEHPTIYVCKDIERKENGNHMRFTPYQAISHFEKAGNGLFLPSFALSCNILAALYVGQSNPEFKQALDQYKDYDLAHGWHAQNTVVDWKGKSIIHYPYDSDFPHDGGQDKVNQNRRRQIDFKNLMPTDCSLVDALNDGEYNRFIKDLTGLQNPEVLIEIGNYFQKDTRVWVPDQKDMNYTGSTWLGCFDSIRFNICTGYSLNYLDAARGVRRP
jgi:hypothetical protein